jgi:uncharacterized protein YbbC (DUF1343 family)
VLGHPLLKDKYGFSFTPVSIPGMSEDPPHKGQVCYGIDLRNDDIDSITKSGKVNILPLIRLYNDFPDKQHYFNSYFTKLAGNKELQKQIEEGKSEAEIRQSWEPALSRFKKTREKYLLYQ